MLALLDLPTPIPRAAIPDNCVAGARYSAARPATAVFEDAVSAAVYSGRDRYGTGPSVGKPRTVEASCSARNVEGSDDAFRQTASGGEHDE